MEFEQLLESRRSIRSFQKGKVPTVEQIKQMVQAAIQAPSWKNSQTSRYYLVHSPEMVQTFMETCLPAFNQESSQGAVYVVTTFVKNRVGFNKETGLPDNECGNGWGYYDLGLHNANLILKARELGLDTLIMGIRDSQKIAELLGIPQTEQIVSVIAVGYRAIQPDKPKRKSPEDILKIY